MPEENNNQPAIPPNDYQNHLIWRNIFIYIILPIQFVANMIGFQRYIREFNEYGPIYASIVLFVAILSLISITTVIIASIKQKPIGYKVIWVYSVFIVIYKIIGYIDAYIFLYFVGQIDFEYSQELASNYLLSDTITVIGYTLIAIINLIYFSHRKFLFGIPDKESIPPESKEEE